MSNLPKALKTSAAERAEQRQRDYKYDGRRRRRIRLRWIMIRRGNRRVLRPAATTLQWARMFEMPTRFLAKTRVGQHEVSTIFMGLDHGVMGEREVFETAIFDAKRECTIFGRCGTYGQAMMWHKAAIYAVQAVGKINGGVQALGHD